jgi:hypothetical protein
MTKGKFQPTLCGKFKVAHYSETPPLDTAGTAEQGRRLVAFGRPVFDCVFWRNLKQEPVRV